MGYSTIFGVKIKIYVQPPPREILNVWLSWIVWTDPFHASSFPSKKEGPDMCIILPHPKAKTPAVHKSCVDVIVASSKHPNKNIPQGNNQPGNRKSQNNQRWDSTNLIFWFLFLPTNTFLLPLNFRYLSFISQATHLPASRIRSRPTYHLRKWCWHFCPQGCWCLKWFTPPIRSGLAWCSTYPHKTSNQFKIQSNKKKSSTKNQNLPPNHTNKPRNKKTKKSPNFERKKIIRIKNPPFLWASKC